MTDFDPRDTVDIPDDRELDDLIPDAVCDVQTEPETAIWHLSYERPISGDFDTYVIGGTPRPMNEHSVPWRIVPSDVRAFAQNYGRANGAMGVSYHLARLCDATGFATTGKVAATAADIEMHTERIN